MEDIAHPGIVVKLARIKDLSTTAASDKAWAKHCLSVDVPPAACSVSFSAVYQPCNLLERPQAFCLAALPQQLYTKSAQNAMRVAIAAFHEVSTKHGVSADLPRDPLQIAKTMSLVDFNSDESALLLTSPPNQPTLWLPPEGFGLEQGNSNPDSDPPSGGAEDCKEAETKNEVALLAAQLVLTQILAAAGPLERTDIEPKTQGKEVYLIWAESVEGIKVSPSLLLAFVLLMARQEAAMFLRMATGFGFAQVGDYTASLFYLFRRRGHRLKCWECGVKKKAPCGKTDRDDLPWCCHRRLGEWIPRLQATSSSPGKGLILLSNKGRCFLPLLPPREALESEDPLQGQLSYAPRAADVVCLSDVLQERPVHPRQTLRKALHRLAPTCRLLWCNTPWIAQTVEKLKAGKDAAAASAHLWLEKTAFFKVPRALQDETVEIHRRPFDALIEDLLPDVEDAPILGGHNRQPPAIAAAPAAALSRTTSAVYEAHANFAGTLSWENFALGLRTFGRVPADDSGAAASAAQCRTCLGPAAARGAAIARRLHRGSSSSSLFTGFGELYTDSGTDGSVQEMEKMWSNTGQGRRRLNARAALRAAGHKDLAAGTSSARHRCCSQLAPKPAGARLQGTGPNLAALPFSNHSSLSSGEVHPSSSLDSAQDKEPDTGAELPTSEPQGALHVDVDARAPSPGTGSPSPVAPSTAATAALQPAGRCFHGLGILPTLLGPADAGCSIRIAPRPLQTRPTRNAADPDPDHLPGQNQKMSMRATALPQPRPAARICTPSEVAGDFAVAPRAGWRKPRTARLQFWNTQTRASGRKRCSSDEEESEAEGLPADNFGGSSSISHAMGRKRPCNTSSSFDDRAPARLRGQNTASMDQLLQAVELAGYSD